MGPFLLGNMAIIRKSGHEAPLRVCLFYYSGSFFLFLIFFPLSIWSNHSSLVKNPLLNDLQNGGNPYQKYSSSFLLILETDIS
jgi:hypothetical protein